ncbi:MAG: aldehyde dehydrogenase family protein [Myxococcales bacterium]|nr:aldehyde dehydrogenase family protein [Myxococcales bacterium]
MTLRSPGATASARRPVTSPFDDREVGSCPVATADDVERALATAHEAHRARLAPKRHARVAILEGVAARLAERREELSRLICDEAGKPIALARAEVDRAGDTFRAARDALTTDRGEVLELSAMASGDGRLGITRRYPVGVIAAITPFNFPLNLVAHKLAPAIAAGCPVVLKPSPQAPLSGFALAELALEAGLPAPMLSVVAGPDDVVAPLVDDPRVALLSFTGSERAGFALRARARGKAVLELGGNAAVVVHDDADLDRAADRIVQGAFAYAGQSCISVQRVLVQRRVHDALRERLEARLDALSVGDPSREDVLAGPVIDDRAVARLSGVLGDVLARGGRALREVRWSRRVLSPTLLVDVPLGHAAREDELFGPVALVDVYDAFEDGLRQADAGRFGLQTGVFTRDVGRLLAAFDALEVGALLHDDVPTFRVDAMPYGGVRRSGVGREGPRDAYLEMTEPRLLLLRH